MTEELPVIPAAHNPPGTGCLEIGPAGRRDVESPMSPPIHPFGTELTERSPAAVGAIDRELVTVEAKRRKREKKARQRCSSTRSTMEYSTASSALMK
jgi:hypothetical protein